MTPAPATAKRTGEGCGAGCACVAAAAVAELQGPVAELRGYLEALTRADGPDPRLLAGARATSDRVREVVDALVAYQDTDRIPHGRPVKLGEVAAAAAEVLADELTSRGVTLHVGRLPTLAADPHQLYRAVVALVRYTAADHPSGTVLTFGALHRDRTWQVRIGPSPTQAGYSQPTGPAPEAMPTGYGVALATAERAVEAHGGEVWFTREPGTVTWFTIPDEPPGTR